MAVDISTESDKKFHPNLNMVHKVLEEKIVGEHQSRMALFTVWVLSDRNVLMQGQRSSGKSWLTDDIAK